MAADVMHCISLPGLRTGKRGEESRPGGGGASLHKEYESSSRLPLKVSKLPSREAVPVCIPAGGAPAGGGRNASFLESFLPLILSLRTLLI